MRTRRTLALAALALFAAPPAAAQQRPDYQTMRYREDWSGTYRGDPFDPLKHIAVTPGGYVWVSFGGQARVRAEADWNYLGDTARAADDRFALVRAYVHADVHAGDWARVFVEARRADVKGRTLPGGVRASDRDQLDWNNLFAELRRDAGGAGATARYGRQELQMGRDRLISPSDWSNARRVFEGATLEVTHGNHALTALYVHPVMRLAETRNEADHGTTLWGLQSAWSTAAWPAVELYALVNETDARGGEPASRRTTAAVRVVRAVGERTTAEIEAGLQSGRMGDDDVQAYMVASDFTHAFAARWSPSLTLGADLASGSSASDAPQSGTWDPLYPLSHSHVGYADVLGRRNLIELRAVVVALPRENVRLRASAHHFRRASAGDAMYNNGSAVARASAPGLSNALGNELDVTASVGIGRHLRFDVGGAVYEPGEFMRQTGTAARYRWAYTALTAIF